MRLWLHMDSSSRERRRFTRRQLNRPVSFYCLDGHGRSGWHLGEILDASPGGLRIRSRREVILSRGQTLVLFCLPEESTVRSHNPVRIRASIAWEERGKLFGLRFL